MAESLRLGFSIQNKGVYFDQDIGEAHYVIEPGHFRSKYPFLPQLDREGKHFGVIKTQRDESGINKAYRLLSTAFALINKIHKKSKNPRIALPKTIGQISFPDGFLNNGKQFILTPRLIMGSTHYPIYTVEARSSQNEVTTLIQMLEVELFKQNQGIRANTAAATINDAVWSVMSMDDNLLLQDHRPNLQSIGYCEFYPCKIIPKGTVDYYVAVEKNDGVIIGEVTVDCQGLLMAQLTGIKIT